VIVRDANGNPVSGVSVTFAAGRGEWQHYRREPDDRRKRHRDVGSWTIGTAAGPNTLTATSTGLNGSPVTSPPPEPRERRVPASRS